MICTKLQGSSACAMSRQLGDRVRGRPDAPGEGAARGLARLFQALPVRVEQPAVVAAAKTSPFGTTQRQRGAAVRALLGQQPEPAAGVPEQHQVLAEQPAPHRHPARHVVGGHRPPVPAQQLPHRGPRADRGQALVLLLAQHARSCLSRTGHHGR
jgi:hypothetical protein